MATPVTAGSAALVRQYFADGWLTHSHSTPPDSLTLSPPAAANAANGFNVSSALVRAVMVNCADDMKGYVQVGSGGGDYKIPAAPSFYQGYGRIHLSNTLCLASYSDDCSLFALEGPTLGVGLDVAPTPAPGGSSGGGAAGIDCINNSDQPVELHRAAETVDRDDRVELEVGHNAPSVRCTMGPRPKAEHRRRFNFIVH